MTPRDHISVAAPATVANLTVGFDCLGLALERPLERLDLKRTDTPGVVIREVIGADLPMQVEHNVSGMAAHSVLHTLGVNWGVELTIHKAVLPGSGIGSSAASAASAAFGVAALAGADFRPDELLPMALDGAQVASGARHADNVAPAIYGGFQASRTSRVAHRESQVAWRVAVGPRQLVRLRALQILSFRCSCHVRKRCTSLLSAQLPC